MLVSSQLVHEVDAELFSHDNLVKATQLAKIAQIQKRLQQALISVSPLDDLTSVHVDVKNEIDQFQSSLARAKLAASTPVIDLPDKEIPVLENELCVISFADVDRILSNEQLDAELSSINTSLDSQQFSNVYPYPSKSLSNDFEIKTMIG